MSTLRDREVLPGVHHIEDALGVCMTLLVGDRAALLVDTGYGTEDVAAFVRTLTALPVEVILTHGHHDHCMGARWFPRVRMFPEDMPDFVTYTGPVTRQRILSSAAAHGIPVDEADYLSALLPTPDALTGGEVALGGLTAHILPCPGHTPGSCVVWVPERSLLLTGDDWNPCTWVFFPRALGVRAYRENVRGLLRLPFTRVLCSHRPALFPREMLERFLSALTDEALRAAHPVRIPPYETIDTRQCDLPCGQLLVFDHAKADL